MKLNAFILGMGLCGAAGLAVAAGGGDAPGGNGSARSEDLAVKSAKDAIAAGDHASVPSGLKVALAGDPGNANLHNLYADSIRKGANPDMPLVFKRCHEALRIDPRHRGAQEYIGEAYLMTSNLPKAKEHLAALDKICFACAEYDMLKKAIAAYEAKPR